jgi:DNA polymerase-3 subunit delta
MSCRPCRCWGGSRLVASNWPSGRPGRARRRRGAEQHLDGAYNPEAFLLIEAGALGKDSGLRRAAEASKIAACVPVYEDEPGDLSRLVREGLARDGVGLTSEALELFTARLPRERGVLRQEIERLVLYLGPGSGVVGDADLLADHMGATADASLSDAANDAAGGRAGPALQGLNRAAAEGEGGVAAVRVMGQHLTRLRRIRVAVDGGAQPQAAAKSAGVFWKTEREVLRQHRAWTAEALDRAQAETRRGRPAPARSPDLPTTCWPSACTWASPPRRAASASSRSSGDGRGRRAAASEAYFSRSSRDPESRSRTLDRVTLPAASSQFLFAA